MNACECGNVNLIYDYRDGLVICPSCGLVVTKIIDNTPTFPRHPQRSVRTPYSVVKDVKNLLRRYVSNKTLYKHAVKIAKRIEKCGLLVDYDKFIKNGGRMIKTFYYKYNDEIYRNIDEKKIHTYVQAGMIMLMKHRADLLCRTERGKLALAFIVGYKHLVGDYPKPSFVTQTFRIAQTTYRRIMEQVTEVFQTLNK